MRAETYSSVLSAMSNPLFPTPIGNAVSDCLDFCRHHQGVDVSMVLRNDSRWRGQPLQECRVEPGVIKSELVVLRDVS